MAGGLASYYTVVLGAKNIYYSIMEKEDSPAHTRPFLNFLAWNLVAIPGSPILAWFVVTNQLQGLTWKVAEGWMEEKGVSLD